MAEFIHRTLDCPVCGVLAIDVLIKMTARYRLKEYKCKSGHKFFAESGQGVGLRYSFRIDNQENI